MDQKELLKLKEKIDEAKDEAQQLEGRKKYLLQELKDDWDCKTVEEAEELLDKIEKDIEKIEDKIEKGIEKLEEEYEFE